MPHKHFKVVQSIAKFIASFEKTRDISHAKRGRNTEKKLTFCPSKSDSPVLLEGMVDIPRT
jgi:hypothetical protein